MNNMLNEYSIHYLRLIARKLNIKSPTTLKKADLIEKIINEDNEEIIKKSGRKPKIYYENRDAKIFVENIILEFEELKNKIDLYISHLKNFIELNKL